MGANDINERLKAIQIQYRKENIKGYEEYQIDTNGVVYSKSGKPLRYSINHSGYCIVNFYSNRTRKGFAVHTLVANQFIKRTDDTKTQVNHIDGNKTNNNVDNLEWVTREENIYHAVHVIKRMPRGSQKPNARKIMAVTKDGNVYKEWGSIADAAIEISGKISGYKNTEIAIWNVLTGRKHTYKGFIWKYI